MYASPIHSVARTGDVSFPFEPIQSERHRRRRDTHMPRQLVHCGRIDFIEVVEDARLVTAEKPSRFLVQYVTGMAGEIDSRVKEQQLLRGVGKIGHG